MANRNTPFGFKPFYAPNGGNFGRQGSYDIASATAADIFNGDLVALTGTRRRITVATVATGFILGSMHGVRYVTSLGDIRFAPYWPTGLVASGLTPGADPEALVHDDPNQEFIAQVDDTAGLTANDIGETADFVASAGSTSTGQSAQVIDQSSFDVSQQLRILALAPLPDNEYGQYAKAICKIRVHQLAEAFTGLS